MTHTPALTAATRTSAGVRLAMVREARSRAALHLAYPAFNGSRRSRVRHAAEERNRREWMKRRIWLVAILVAGSLVAAQEPSRPAVEWLNYGGDPGNTKYSALNEINAG